MIWIFLSAVGVEFIPSQLERINQLILPNEVSLSLSSLQSWPPSTANCFSLPLHPSIELCSPKSSTPWSCSGSVKLTFPSQNSIAFLPKPLPKPGMSSHLIITTCTHTRLHTHTHTHTHTHLNMVLRMHRDFMGILSSIITLSWHAYACTCTDITMVIGVWGWVCWKSLPRVSMFLQLQLRCHPSTSLIVHALLWDSWLSRGDIK